MEEEEHHEGDLVRRLQAEVAEWRRRAEMAEAIAAERLARAQSAERALAAADAALQRLAPPTVPVGPPAPPGPQIAGDSEPHETARPRSWLERWRRYTDSIT